MPPRGRLQLRRVGASILADTHILVGPVLVESPTVHYGDPRRFLEGVCYSYIFASVRVLVHQGDTMYQAGGVSGKGRTSGSGIACMRLEHDACDWNTMHAIGTRRMRLEHDACDWNTTHANAIGIGCDACGRDAKLASETGCGVGQPVVTHARRRAAGFLIWERLSHLGVWRRPHNCRHDSRNVGTRCACNVEASRARESRAHMRLRHLAASGA